jgi:hypothetical protein
MMGYKFNRCTALAVLAAVLGFSRGLYAEIVYTAANETVEGTGILKIDLNHDGVTDVSIVSIGGGGYVCNKHFVPSPWGHVYAMPGRGSATVEKSWAFSNTFGNLVLAFSSGAKISSQDAFHSAEGLMLAYGSCVYPNSGDWQNVTNLYLAIRFQINGQAHYGWARLTVLEKPVNPFIHTPGPIITLTGYAYESVPGAPIVAGQTTVVTSSLTLKVTSPLNDSTVTNPVSIAATASDPNPISQIEVWVNYKEVFHVSGGTLNADVTLPVGSDERFVVQAVDSKGTSTKVDSITVSGTPLPPPSTTSNVTTYHNDNGRTGQNLDETTLTAANVKASNFGLLFVIATDGKVDAQPLYLPNLTISGSAHNVLFVATEHGSVYGFDADTGIQLWKVSTLAAGERPSDDHGCRQITPEIGVTSTPVIDSSTGDHGTIYVVAMSKDGSGNYHQRLHALDVTTGAEEFGGPKEIQASYPGTGDNSSGGNVIFDSGQQVDRPGLLLLNGVVYTSWGSHCDIRPYTGWVIAYDEHTLSQVMVLNVTPNGNEGSFWMSGAGPAADASGNIFALDANGTFDSTLNAQGFPSRGDFGNAFLKMATTNGQLAVVDYFEMSNQSTENSTDEDLGSGGALVLPDLTDSSGTTRHLAVGAGKDAIIYIVDRDSMGKFNPNSNNVYQQVQGALAGGVFSMPAFFNNTLYYGAVGDKIKAFSINSAKLVASATSQTPKVFRYPGATPSISANGSKNAILWATENGNPAVLHAFDARNLANELYNSNQASGGRDHFGAGNKFITPTVVNGKVYVGTTTGVGVFGLMY